MTEVFCSPNMSDKFFTMDNNKLIFHFSNKFLSVKFHILFLKRLPKTYSEKHSFSTCNRIDPLLIIIVWTWYEKLFKKVK